MVHRKTPTLPNILQEYDPDYVQKTSGQVKIEQETSHHGNKPTTPRIKKAKDKDGSRSMPPPLSRESTTEIKQRQDREKNKRVFDFWQKVKKDLREAEIERLQEKIVLQHELLRIQEEQHQQRQEQRRQLEIKKREKEKAERNAMFKALQQVCQESLDEDRHAVREKLLAEKHEKQSKKDDQCLHSTEENDVTMKKPLDSPSQSKEPVGTEEPSETPVSPPTTLPRPSVSGLHDEVFETLEEAEEEDETTMPDQEEVLPWHHIQLYELYGKDADYFLHPKIEQETKADVVLNPRLKAIGGRADAGALWDALRHESRMKLVNMDLKLLSPELQAAFGAFAREGLTKNKKPVTRNFYSSEDVPDMSLLMDQTRIHNAQDFRHKVELMFRSSNINRDQTKVLLYNNPPPDLNNQDGSEGINRYMPSWAENWDEESELSYKKWLPSLQNEESLPIKHISDDNKSRSHQAHSLQRDKGRKPGQNKYLFLTEEQATTPGQFSRRRKELEETRGCPAAYKAELPPIQKNKSHSAMAMLGPDVAVSPEPGADIKIVNKRERQRAQSEMSNHYNEWQPLSLNALVEHRESQVALGQGEFAHGQKAVWSGLTSVPAI